jgi:hypothetical protein
VEHLGAVVRSSGDPTMTLNPGRPFSKWVQLIYRWSAAFVEPRRMLRAFPGLLLYLRDWRRFRRIAGAPPTPVADSYPCLGDRTAFTTFDPHYLYQGVWATSRVHDLDPDLHVDVGSHLGWVSSLAAVRCVVFVDIRPATVTIPNLSILNGDGIRLPLASRSIRSLSCLHVAEHVGLGRYGDKLDPHGARRMCSELARILAAGGVLLFSIPIGRPRVCFNAHRVFDPFEIIEYFDGLELSEFSAVTDDRRFVQRYGNIEDFRTADYACGLYRFTRP